jgi:hypothetical protein
MRITPYGLWLDDHGIANVTLEFEIEPLAALNPAVRRSPPRSKRGPLLPPPSQESGDRG